MISLKNLLKENIIANKAACQMITHITKIPLFIYFFNINYIEKYDVLLPLIVAVFIGTYFGKKILSFIPEALFKKLFRFTLLIIAIRLIFNFWQSASIILLLINALITGRNVDVKRRSGGPSQFAGGG